MAIQKYSLYDPELSAEDLFNLRFQFWKTLETFFDESVCYPEIQFSARDESGEVIFGNTLELHDANDDYNPYYASFCTGCGVFTVKDDPYKTRIGNLEAENNQWYIGYTTNNGIMVVIRDMVNELDSGVVVIGKSNSGVPAFLGRSAGDIRHASAIDAHVAAADDDVEAEKVRLTFLPETETTYSNVRTGQVGQTILCPVPTHNQEGRVSYIEGLYCMPWSQYRGAEGTIILHGRRYVTNGYYALLDD